MGTRHGEKLYEALLSREERACAQDLRGYYRVPADARDLNYAKFVEQGEQKLTQTAHGEDYNSHNTQRLDVAGMKQLLLKLDFMQKIARGEARRGRGVIAMKVLITGANGFVGKNLQLHLTERKDIGGGGLYARPFAGDLPALLQGVDFVFHLAGINRPQGPGGICNRQCRADRGGLPLCWPRAGNPAPVVLSSSDPGGAAITPMARASGRLRMRCSSMASTGAPAVCLPPDQCVRQVVQAELQLGGGNFLPQHGARPGDHDQRSGCAVAPGVYRRCGGGLCRPAE